VFSSMELATSSSQDRPKTHAQEHFSDVSPQLQPCNLRTACCVENRSNDGRQVEGISKYIPSGAIRFCIEGEGWQECSVLFPKVAHRLQCLGVFFCH